MLTHDADGLIFWLLQENLRGTINFSGWYISKCRVILIFLKNTDRSYLLLLPESMILTGYKFGS